MSVLNPDSTKQKLKIFSRQISKKIDIFRQTDLEIVLISHEFLNSNLFRAKFSKNFRFFRQISKIGFFIIFRNLKSGFYTEKNLQKNPLRFISVKFQKIYFFRQIALENILFSRIFAVKNH